MPDEPLQEILKQPLSPSDSRSILLGLGLAFDRVLCKRLFRRDRWNDQYRIQTGQGLMQTEERGVSSSCLMRLHY
jgi:hypothetical protein